MFPDGAKEPYERTRRIIQKFAGPLKALPNRLSVTGHTAASRVRSSSGTRYMQHAMLQMIGLIDITKLCRQRG